MSPFVSQSQRAKFYSDPKLHKFIPEYEAATKGKLPERIGKAKPTRKQMLKNKISAASAKAKK